VRLVDGGHHEREEALFQDATHKVFVAVHQFLVSLEFVVTLLRPLFEEVADAEQLFAALFVTLALESVKAAQRIDP